MRNKHGVDIERIFLIIPKKMKDKFEKLAKKKNVAISFSYKYFVKEEQTRKEKPCY
jgi:RNase P/RNase MRP subunit p30